MIGWIVVGAMCLASLGSLALGLAVYYGGRAVIRWMLYR